MCRRPNVHHRSARPPSGKRASLRTAEISWRAAPSWRWQTTSRSASTEQSSCSCQKTRARATIDKRDRSAQEMSSSGRPHTRAHRQSLWPGEPRMGKSRRQMGRMGNGSWWRAECQGHLQDEPREDPPTAHTESAPGHAEEKECDGEHDWSIGRGRCKQTENLDDQPATK